MYWVQKNSSVVLRNFNNGRLERKDNCTFSNIRGRRLRWSHDHVLVPCYYATFGNKGRRMEVWTPCRGRLHCAIACQQTLSLSVSATLCFVGASSLLWQCSGPRSYTILQLLCSDQRHSTEDFNLQGAPVK